jgi:hypothetical protein
VSRRNGRWHDHRVGEEQLPISAIVETPSVFGGRELLDAIAQAGVSGRIVTNSEYEAEMRAAAQQLTPEILGASPAVIRKEIAAFGRRFPRRSGEIRDLAFELDAQREGENLARDADTLARVQRLMRAAGDYNVAGQPATGDDRAERLRAFRGRRRSPFWVPWWRLLSRAGEIDEAARVEAVARVTEMQPPETGSGELRHFDQSSQVLEVVKVIAPHLADGLAFPLIIEGVKAWLKAPPQGREAGPKDR